MTKELAVAGVTTVRDRRAVDEARRAIGKYILLTRFNIKPYELARIQSFDIASLFYLDRIAKDEQKKASDEAAKRLKAEQEKLGMS